jgi:hypothetical protein
MIAREQELHLFLKDRNGRLASPLAFGTASVNTSGSSTTAGDCTSSLYSHRAVVFPTIGFDTHLQCSQHILMLSNAQHGPQDRVSEERPSMKAL